MSGISVVIPNYNDSAGLAACIERYMDQSRPPDAIIVVDDGSTDSSPAVLEDISRKHPVVRHIAHGRNRGVCHATNTGLGHATGEFVAFGSVNDSVDRDFLRVTSQILGNHPAAAFCATGYRTLDLETGETVAHGVKSDTGYWFCDGRDPVHLTGEAAAEKLARRFFWPPSNGTLFRRALALKAGGYPADFRWHADWYLVFKLLLLHGGVFTPGPCSTFTIDRQSYSSRGMRSPGGQAGVLWRIFRHLHTREPGHLRAQFTRAASVYSPFVGAALMAAFAHPGHWRLGTAILRWWMSEIRRGRRPKTLRALARKSPDMA